MSITTAATVRMFGALHSVRRERGLPSKTEVDLPAAGCSAREVARKLELPMEKVEAVFINHRACDLKQTVKPGDRVAFVPKGVPSVEAFMLGIHGRARPS